MVNHFLLCFNGCFVVKIQSIHHFILVLHNHQGLDCIFKF